MDVRKGRFLAGTLTPSRLDLPTGDPLVAELFPPLVAGAEWKLDRMEDLLREIGSPHEAYPVIHIGGTNGKGSVASTVSSILECDGTRTGLYTSPHLCAFRERFVVGGRQVEDQLLRELAGEIADPIVAHGLTFFEAATALAFTLFARLEVSVAVVEVGLGGRLDATNVVRPVVAAVTNVAMDHADYLGDTVARIATEKAGIIKAGVPLVTTAKDPVVRSILRAEADRVSAPVCPVELVESVPVEVDEHHTGFRVKSSTWGELELSTPLVGRHQAQNAALAVRIVDTLPEELRPSGDAVRTGVAEVCWPGRCQVEHLGGLTWLFDVAHNPAGVRTLVEVMDRLELDGPIVLLVGVLGDKDWGAMLPDLFERASGAVLTQPPSAPPERLWDPQEAARSVGDTLLTPEIEQDFDLAMTRAGTLAGRGTVVVTGSNHTVGDALSRLGLDPS
jgi:dihydrofolate synthase / folylpolyglutamate synthase